MLKDIINISKTIKCRYPNISNERLDTNLYYSSHENIMNSIKTNEIMDCGSVIWNILLQYYFDKDCFDNYLEKELGLDLLKIYNPEFHLFFNKKLNDTNNLNYNLTYIKYEPFHLLYNENIKHISTNNMGYWCINLGVGINIIEEIESLVSYNIDYKKECYLVFWPNKGIIICNIDYIINTLINDAKKDIENFKKTADNIIGKSVLGLLNILMEKENITFDSIKVINMGYLLKSNNEKRLNLANMYMNKGNNLVNL